MHIKQTEVRPRILPPRLDSADSASLDSGRSPKDAYPCQGSWVVCVSRSCHPLLGTADYTAIRRRSRAEGETYRRYLESIDSPSPPFHLVSF
jgi:hypothetical protein